MLSLSLNTMVLRTSYSSGMYSPRQTRYLILKGKVGNKKKDGYLKMYGFTDVGVNNIDLCLNHCWF